MVPRGECNTPALCDYADSVNGHNKAVLGLYGYSSIEASIILFRHRAILGTVRRTVFAPVLALHLC